KPQNGDSFLGYSSRDNNLCWRLSMTAQPVRLPLPGSLPDSDLSLSKSHSKTSHAFPDPCVLAGAVAQIEQQVPQLRNMTTLSIYTGTWSAKRNFVHASKLVDRRQDEVEPNACSVFAATSRYVEVVFYNLTQGQAAFVQQIAGPFPRSLSTIYW